MKNFIYISIITLLLFGCSKSNVDPYETNNIEPNLDSLGITIDSLGNYIDSIGNIVIIDSLGNVLIIDFVSLLGEWTKVLHEEVELFGIYTDNTFSYSYYTGEELTNLIPTGGIYTFTDSLVTGFGFGDLTFWDYHNNILSFTNWNLDWIEYGEVILLTNDSLVISRTLIEDYMLWGEDPIQFTDLQITEYFLRN